MVVVGHSGFGRSACLHHSCQKSKTWLGWTTANVYGAKKKPTTTTEGSKTVRVGWQQLASLINWERFVHLRFRVHTLLQVCPSTWFIPNVPYTSSANGGCMSSKMTLATETTHKPSSPYIHRFWIGQFLQVINMFVTAFKLLSLLIFHLINVFLVWKKNPARIDDCFSLPVLIDLSRGEIKWPMNYLSLLLPCATINLVEVILWGFKHRLHFFSDISLIIQFHTIKPISFLERCVIFVKGPYLLYPTL